MPRTRHKAPDGSPLYTNRLILESSPYLLQHAHNPVNWFPWGDEAFARAKATGRPVFLSVGYSTCHWCHVMEEESFEDEDVARYLNEHYVAIKVDREERPDVDAVYMTAVENLTGNGGWPMSVWLTPEREPFFAGTYFPPRDGARGGGRGFLGLAREQADRFLHDPAGVAEQARKLAASVREAMAAAPSGGLIGPEPIERVVEMAAQRYDRESGGMRGAPKFPSSFPLRVLLRSYRRTGETPSLDMVTGTLKHMAAGGIYDHVGGGFHRYSTDRRWLVPHFEKMLYDSSQLAITYLEAWQASGEEDFARVTRETLDYLLRDMQSPEGGFYSATDADSTAPSGHREEGWFFTWTPAEIEAAVGPEGARVVLDYFAVGPRGNFESRTILSTPRSRADTAASLGIPREALDAALADAIPRLREARSKRPPPLCDDKVQASWNGLAISALSRAALAFAEPRYRDAAIRSATFVLHELARDGRLVHAWTAGHASSEAFLEDYAFVAAALLDLFELTSDPRWLRDATRLMDELQQGFADAVNGGYFRTRVGHEALLSREKPDDDGAVPSGNSIALMNALRLAELTGDERWRERASRTAAAFAGVLSSRPWSLGEMLLGIDFWSDEPKEIAVVVPEGATAAATEPIVAVLRRAFVPNRVMVIAGEAQLAGELGKLVPWAADKPAKNGKPTAYVCRRGACELPTSDPSVFAQQLGRRTHR